MQWLLPELPSTNTILTFLVTLIINGCMKQHIVFYDLGKDGYNNIILEQTYNGLMSGDKNIVPLKVAILAAFLFYRYKFLSQAKDKNLYRLP
ncbi:hypothetical protein FHS19_003271 [Paenibacillus rhizosphaerae]|uniref:Uncharacterized protein n=1 Tax=Paenibacillus rhizosphaerae TaxID=297318 RepID=A0A839TVA5_9BACL|nr:hypothetical protein [Paenibacillus rhizosphaerae]